MHGKYQGTVMVSILFVFFATILNGSKVLSLRLTGIQVPPVAIAGSSVWLNCTYELEDDQLYSIKWYRNDQEFYRFVPNGNPQAQIFSSQGLYVNVPKSSNGSVYLNRVDLKTDGRFRCEVSAEAPSFQTVRKEADMKVYYLPKDDPQIFGTRAEYQIGDIVNVSCKAGPAKPAAQLIWYINDELAPSEYVNEAFEFDGHSSSLRPSSSSSSSSLLPFSSPLLIRNKWSNMETENQEDDQLKTSYSVLSFKTDQHHFQHGIIKLRCIAVVSQVFSRHQEVIVRDEDKVKQPRTVYEGDSPVITGGKSSYTIGDLVNVTCTSRKSNPGAELRWFINDIEADPRFLRHYNKVSYTDGSEISILRLEFIVTPDDYTNANEMRLKCASTLFKVINTQSQETTISGYSGLFASSSNVRMESFQLIINLILLLLWTIC